MKTIGGWGGVKISITLGATTTEVIFTTKKAYCTQPEYKPALREHYNIGGTSFPAVSGYRLAFKALFENVDEGDEANIYLLMQIIDISNTNSIPMTLWPKYDAAATEMMSYAVYCRGKFYNEDVNAKRNIAQRVKELEFETEELGTEILSFFPGMRKITVSTTALNEFSVDEAGTPSASQSFTITPRRLTANIELTAETGFEISTDDVSYSGTLSLASSYAGTIYVRLTGAAEGIFAGNIEICSSGAETKYVAVSGTVGHEYVAWDESDVLAWDESDAVVWV